MSKPVSRITHFRMSVKKILSPHSNYFLRLAISCGAVYGISMKWRCLYGVFRGGIPTGNAFRPDVVVNYRPLDRLLIGLARNYEIRHFDFLK